MTNFLNLTSDYNSEDGSYFKILPIPYEGTVCFEHGTAQGPERICAVSDQMEYIDEETFCEFWRDGVHTLPSIEPQKTPSEEMAAIERTVRENHLFDGHHFPIALGGEHSITSPIVKVAAENYPNLSVLQFDAHSDLRDTFEPGGKFSHASVMRRVLEITPNLVQVGIRSFSEQDLIEIPQRVEKFVPPKVLESNLSAAVELICKRLTETVYITFDMDAFDPSVAPGVGTPEPGGLSWRQVTTILAAVFAEKNVIGADVVETMPLGGNNVVTEFLAARLVGKIMTAKFLNRGR